MTGTHKVSPNHFLNGNFAPTHIECDTPNLKITGTLPSELCGTFYRVGPNPQHAPRDDHYHWFAGDGMVHAFFIGAGMVSYKNRWLRTPKWRLENAAGKALFGTFGNPATSDPAAIGQHTGTANTNIVRHGGRLFALEESHQAFEFDFATLESKGYQSFGERVTSRFTAHPKADPQTGELHFFAYCVDGPGSTQMQYGVLDSDCTVTRLDAFSVPYASMVHDFVTTSGYVLFPIMPLTSSMDRVIRGQPMFAWETGLDTHIGILPRKAGIDALRWLTMDSCHVFHFMNAFDDGDRMVVYAMEAQMAPGLPYADGRVGEAAQSAARLCRWTIDLTASSDAIRRDFLDDLPAEFPRIDERWAGRRNQYGWYVCHADDRVRDDTESVLYGTLALFDFTTGRRQLYRLPQGDVLSEPVFAPRAGGVAEGDGWILALAWRETEQRSDLLVFDATQIENGPVAIAHLPYRVPFGFHGAWRPDAIDAL